MTKASEALRATLLAENTSVPGGPALTPLDEAIISLGTQAAVTALDPPSVDRAIAAALAQGATLEQVQETLTLVSGLGTHSLMVATPMLLSQGRAAGLIDDGPLDADRAALWAHYVGEISYWRRFEQSVPGFLEALLRLSPATFKGFFEYCALPQQTRSLSPMVSELIALATDVAPSHTFEPGARLHLANALKLGAGVQMIRQTLEIAAVDPAMPTD